MPAVGVGRSVGWFLPPSARYFASGGGGSDAAIGGIDLNADRAAGTDADVDQALRELQRIREMLATVQGLVPELDNPSDLDKQISHIRSKIDKATFQNKPTRLSNAITDLQIADSVLDPYVRER